MRLIEKVWFRGHPAKWLLVPLLLPLTLLFYLISSLRRVLFTVGFKQSVTLTAPVIVVGNIGVGGNGKTPIVIYLVELTRQLGFKPGVISRGYGGSAPHYPYLLKEDTSTNIAGDEPVLIYQRCQVPVAVGSDRIASAQLLIEQGCNVIISDDGLQHYRLARALELVIVDAKRLFGNGLLLPAGPLREGKWRLNRSDLIVFNGDFTRPIHGVWYKNLVTPRATMNLQVTVLRNMATDESIHLSEFLNNNSEVNAIAGIGDPQRFFDTLLAQKLTLAKTQAFVDHHRFCLDDFKHFNDNIPLLMTEKDAVKCYGFSKKNWWFLPVDSVFSTIEKQKITELLIKKLTS